MIVLPTCDSCGENRKKLITVRGIGRERYCRSCALAYGRHNWVNPRRY